MMSFLIKIGNSTGTIIPAQILKDLKLKKGDRLSIVEDHGKIVISAANSRPKYQLAELLARCDQSAPIPEALTEWDAANPVGNEV